MCLRGTGKKTPGEPGHTRYSRDTRGGTTGDHTDEHLARPARKSQDHPNPPTHPHRTTGGCASCRHEPLNPRPSFGGFGRVHAWSAPPGVFFAIQNCKPAKRHRGEPGHTRDTHGTVHRHARRARPFVPTQRDRHTGDAVAVVNAGSFSLWLRVWCSIAARGPRGSTALPVGNREMLCLAALQRTRG